MTCGLGLLFLKNPVDPVLSRPFHEARKYNKEKVQTKADLQPHGGAPQPSTKSVDKKHHPEATQNHSENLCGSLEIGAEAHHYHTLLEKSHTTQGRSIKTWT